jgi:hexosaminidase
MELDTPGHTTILAVSHPELIACAFATPWAQFANGQSIVQLGEENLAYDAIEPPAGQLRVANNETIQFTAGLVKAMSSMFPSKFFNTGGDEINANCYAMDNQTQQELGTCFPNQPRFG